MTGIDGTGKKHDINYVARKKTWQGLAWQVRKMTGTTGQEKNL